MVSLVIPRLEETMLAPLLMKTFPKDPKFLDRKVTGTPQIIQKRATATGQLETSCLAAKQRRGGDSCS